jgi:hypothetical protein
MAKETPATPLYTPNYPDLSRVSTEMLPYCRMTLREATRIEEETQRAVAERQPWLLAKNIGLDDPRDSRAALHNLGFVVLGDAHLIFPKCGRKIDLFYEVRQPKGWTRSTKGFQTDIRDESGKVRLEQYFKGSFYDAQASLTVLRDR